MNCTTCMIGDFKSELCPTEFCKQCGKEGSSEDIEEILMNYKLKWIPINKQVPEFFTINLITIIRQDENWNNNPYIRIAQYTPHGWTEIPKSLGTFFGEDILKIEDGNPIVLAWMPLPEPWKGADDEN